MPSVVARVDLIRWSPVERAADRGQHPICIPVGEVPLRLRSSSRLLVLDPTGSLLLFRFVHKRGALSGSAFWATPGGELMPGESFADAAIRELREETGFVVASVGEPIGRRGFELRLPDGEDVLSDERFFLVHVQDREIHRDGWTPLEVEVMADHRWWRRADLACNSRCDDWPGELGFNCHFCRGLP